MPVVWDERKRLINIAQHGFDFALVESEFDFGGAVYTPAKDARIKAVGRFEGRLSVLILRALGEEAISRVSLRIASKKESAAHGSQARRG